MDDVTEILSRLSAGELQAADELLPVVYQELKQLAAARMSRERDDHTLQATALVHEAYLRLVAPAGDGGWENRGHFFAAAAEAMRRILVDSARARKSLKRGGGRRRLDLGDMVEAPERLPDVLLDLDEGLERLAAMDSESAELVKLRLFAGLSVTEAGSVMGMSRSTAYENWEFARSWFAAFLDDPP